MVVATALDVRKADIMPCSVGQWGGDPSSDLGSLDRPWHIGFTQKMQDPIAVIRHVRCVPWVEHVRPSELFKGQPPERKTTDDGDQDIDQP